MKITVTKPNAKRIDFIFELGAGDAMLPFPAAYITGDKIFRLRDGIISLIAFLMVRDAISNTLVFDGIEVPAHQAAAFQRAFAGFELYIHPITNAEKAILPALPPLTQETVLSENEQIEADLAVRIDNLGFSITSRAASADTERQVLKSSVPLFCAMACRDPVATLHAIQACLAFEIHGATAIVNADKAFQNAPIRRLLADSGFSFVLEAV